MVTVQDVQSVTFEKAMRGYQVEQVDNFLDRIAAQLEDNEKQLQEMSRNNEELKAKLLEMAKKLEGYRSDEDALKSALLNAQRMGENVIREAKQKSDAIVREANIRAEDITRAAQARTSEQEIELQRIKSEVAQFKSNVLSLYKVHIESLSTLPDAQPEDEEEAVPEAQAAAQAPDEVAVQQEQHPAEEPAPIEPAEEETIEPAALQPTEPDDAEGFWQKDENELRDPADEKAMQQDTFRGISFSD